MELHAQIVNGFARLIFHGKMRGGAKIPNLRSHGGLLLCQGTVICEFETSLIQYQLNVNH